MDKGSHTTENVVVFFFFVKHHFLCSFSATEGKAVPSLPNFGNSYHVKGKQCMRLNFRASFSSQFSLIIQLFHISIAGVISLPYAEIKEPFEAWLDLAGKSSRIDYYHGKKPLGLWLFVVNLFLYFPCLVGLVMWNWEPLVSDQSYQSKAFST